MHVNLAVEYYFLLFEEPFKHFSVSIPLFDVVVHVSRPTSNKDFDQSLQIYLPLLNSSLSQQLSKSHLSFNKALYAHAKMFAE